MVLRENGENEIRDRIDNFIKELLQRGTNKWGGSRQGNVSLRFFLNMGKRTYVC